ncbi:hypothetical protein [Synechocystis sp. LKSZ1]|uniref:hypothetical protein n=1 Tax=Synechocystis sp. LKSZ1 TaxID=3144951 RepID=UPI00336C16D7
MSNADFFSLFSADEPSHHEHAADLNSSLQEMGLELDAEADDFEAMFDHLGLEEDPEMELLALVEQTTQKTAPSLIPPFFQAHQALQQKVQILELALAEAEQQLSGQDRRTQSNDDLIQQQAEALKTAQEQLAHTVAELTVYQQEAQHQQFQVETLAEDLARSQQQVQEFEQECQRLRQDQALQSQQMAALEHQTQDLQARLQRQQRYTLQYKSALEQCLTQPNFQPSSDIASAIAALTGKLSEIRPWSSSPSTTSPDLAESESPLVPSVAAVESPPPTLETLPVTEPALAIPSYLAPEVTPLPARPAREKLSFSIQPQKTSRRPIDLPRFLSQSAPQA